MFEDFAKKKFDSYLSLIEFTQGKTSLTAIRSSQLPPYIVSFFESHLENRKFEFPKKDAEDILNKAIVFNINYVIRPKATLLKFLFGNLESRPKDYVIQRLAYFQFYNYYIRLFYEFINLNNPEFIEKIQFEKLIDEVNSKISEEISDEDSEKEKNNLIKLLYYFFLDLTDNNPVNIQLPKKILSVFFNDKGYMILKKRVDEFFADEIFIQEAVELMSTDYVSKKNSSTDPEARMVKDIVTKAKSQSAGQDEKPKSISITISENTGIENLTGKAEEIIHEASSMSEVKEIIGKDLLNTSSIEDKSILKEEIYSEDLLFASSVIEPVKTYKPKSTIDIVNDLFCEVTIRNKIIKKIFRKNESFFVEFSGMLIEKPNWSEASELIRQYFEKNRIDYYSKYAVKFVDLVENHFIKQENLSDKLKAGNAD